MKIRWYDRALIALSGLLLLALGLGFIMTGLHAPKAVYDNGIKLIQAFLGLSIVHMIRQGVWYALAILIACGLLLILWGIRQFISLIPKRHKETFFLATELEQGSLSIARPALEHLVQKCVAEHPEITVSKTQIIRESDKAIIRLRATIRSGVSMPKVTSSLRKEIIEYLSDCAGIAVSNVQVIVDDTTPPLMLPESTTGSLAPRALPESITAKVQSSYTSSIVDSNTDDKVIPIPLGSFVVEDEPAVPVMASMSYQNDIESPVAVPDVKADERLNSIEYNDYTTESKDEDVASKDPEYSVDDDDDYVSIDGDDADEDQAVISEGGDTHAI